MLFQANQQIGNYTLIKFLGEGGFGEVWLAENRNNPSSEKVAIKLPRKEQIDLQAVKDEIFNWTLSGKHKNILPIIECETFDNQIAIVSEFAPDGSLQDLINKQLVFSVADAAEFIIGILDGLAHLHNRKIIHRDLKPENVLFQGRIPRLTDFGISRALPVGSKSATISGTLSYMAPEAFDGKRTEKTDIWSIGVIIYQMLAGNLPFPQQERVELMGAIVMREPQPLPDSIPLDLQNIVKKSLEKDSTKRYQTAEEMKADLNEALKSWENSKPKSIIDEPNPVQPIDVTIPMPILPTEDWQNISQSQLETEEYREEKEIPNQTTEPSIPEENNETLPFGNSEQVEETKPYVNFFSSQVEDNQPAKTGRLKPEFDIPKLLSTKQKSNRLYFAIPAILLMLVAIVVSGLWLNSRANNDQKKIASNTSSKESPAPISTPTPLKDENVETMLIPFRKGDKFGFSDENKKLLIEAKYDYAMPFGGGLAKVKSNEKYGYIDVKGKEVVQIKYDYIYSFSEGIAKVELNNKYGFVDKLGNEVVSPKYDSVDEFTEGMAKVQINKKIGFVNSKGLEIIPLKYEQGESFSEGLANVRLSGKEGFIDKNNNVIIPFIYDTAKSFSEGLAAVGINNLNDECKGATTICWGFVNKEGKEIIPIKYDGVEDFSEGMAGVYINWTLAFIDIEGKLIIPARFEYATGSKYFFKDGLACVYYYRKKGKYGCIDKTGKEIVPFTYEEYFEFVDGYATVVLNKKKGISDKTGKEIIPIKYVNQE